MAAIVEKNDVSVSPIALDSFARAVLDRVGRCLPPIETGYIPHYGLKPELACSREHRRASGSIRWTKKLRHDSRGVGNDLRAVGEFAHNVPARL